jgi:rhodanese-related sulfurtransferase
MKKIAIILGFGFLLFLGVQEAKAQEVGITKDIKNVIVETDNGPITIERDQNTNALIDPDYAKTSRACPPFCVQPMKVAEGVESIGELEIIDFLKAKKGLMIDARTEQWYFKGTIPGSVNISYVEITTRMDELGCKKNGEKWDCTAAKELVLYCNGPWCGQSPTAIKALLREGYPADKLKYYRGGMQAWKSLGLTVVEGGL